MITVLLLLSGLILVVGLVLLVLKSGMKSGRPGQSGEAEIQKQRDEKRPRPVN